ncbi:sodium:proton antiporter [Rhodocaloribacter litoris]|uniref:sodium:proton antiporter n=1 Tax=Rhodocaloribacter litoris TaxID=2558931 RepID=UPI001E38D66D|nr:sodium:proton antiporter [Rhodocaloribacter litoris]
MKTSLLLVRLARSLGRAGVLLLLMLAWSGPYDARAQEAVPETPVVADTVQDGAVARPEAPAAEPAQEAGAAVQEAEAHGEHASPPVWLVLPFVAILLMIATGPLFYPHHWHHHYPKYAVGLGLVVVFYYIFGMGTVVPVQHALDEYLSFIALVASLFIAASGIFVSINAKGTPRNNIILLFGASVIANLIATTGSAMLFIRSYMRLNKGRLKAYHIIFFIFLVANVGGALTPIGDPPLFLGFLRGVPFFWTLTHVWYIWLPTTILILAVFYVFDKRNKLESPDPEPGKPILSLQGTKSFFWVLLIILLVFVDPNVFPWVPSPKNLHLPFGFHLPLGIREIGMFLVAFLAYKTADREALAKNEFNFEPIREVGWLFLGIFATMQPALELISEFAQHHAEDLTVGMFYWGTGMLSGILDNAPTYLNFVAAAMGKFGLDVNLPAHVKDFALPEMAHPDSWHFLQAISVAAVFFGAMSYIGNAPNFMVKAIAEANGVETPSFMGYIVRYSIPILIPIYFVIYVIFYSGWVLSIN